MAGAKPISLTIRMYQVGFGDCFLLSFGYARPLADGRDKRHVLIDFGTMGAARRGDIPRAAKLISEHSGGQIDTVVVSHRHRDHMSGFGNEDIAELLGQPSLVVRSWTENPRAPRGAESAKFVSGLREARGFAEELLTAVRDAPETMVGRNLKRLAEDQVSNPRAVAQLEKWAKAGNAAYVHYGQPSKIEDVVPGIKVRVLGPPTVEQYRKIKSQRAEDPDEFWMLYKRLIADVATPVAGNNLRRSRGAGTPGPTRWLTDRMDRQRSNSLLRIVRILDEFLNNTSLILLFEIPSASGVKRLLFGGDAQIENWEYALKVAPDAKANLALLRKVDLYKVGHHGSRNATPRTLFNLWNEPATARRKIVGLMSTKPGQHGAHAETAVPRETLVNALRERMDFYSTDELPDNQDFVELTLDLRKGGHFVSGTKGR